MTYEQLVQVLIGEGFDRRSAEFEADIILGEATDENIDHAIEAVASWNIVATHTNVYGLA
jgi:hypothetical protein